MSLDSQLWEQLQAHGVYESHMRMLLRLLQTQRNGSWAWDFANGTICQCDSRLKFPSREREVTRVCDALLGGDEITDKCL